MNPVRMMAKLTARGVMLTGGSGGQVLISAEDVAGAMGMGNLPHLAETVARARFCDDNRAQMALHGWVQTWWRRDCIRHGWATDYCEGLATLCVFDLVYPMHCSGCSGRGSRWEQHPVSDAVENVLRVGSQWRSCDSCNGTGRRELTVRDRAAIACMGKSQYANVWAVRVNAMMQDLWSLEQKAVRHLWSQFAADAA